ncbi:MAG TPA: hypothetical protein PKJ51_04960, partial [Methanothrix sp.]|nr:hypothetical protein [Methanothrix sp.]
MTSIVATDDWRIQETIGPRNGIENIKKNINMNNTLKLGLLIHRLDSATKAPEESLGLATNLPHISRFGTYISRFILSLIKFRLDGSILA